MDDMQATGNKATPDPESPVSGTPSAQPPLPGGVPSRPPMPPGAGAPGGPAARSSLVPPVRQWARNATKYRKLLNDDAKPPTVTLEEPATLSQKVRDLAQQGKNLPFWKGEIKVPPLLCSLAQLFFLGGQDLNANALVEKLKLAPGETLSTACLRVAREQGFSTSTFYRKSIDLILPFSLPCVLMLKENQTCVLLSVNKEKAQVLFPGSSKSEEVFVEALDRAYTGYAVFPVVENSTLPPRPSRPAPADRKGWFWGTLLYFLPIYRHSITASLVVNLVGMCAPIFTMTVYDRVLPNNSLDTLWILVIGISIAYIIDFILKNLRSFFVDEAGKNADIVLASRIMRQFLSLRLDAKEESNSQMANTIREFDTVRNFFGASTILALLDLPFLFLFIFLLFYVGGILGFVTLAAIPIVLIIGILLQKPMQNQAEKGFKENMEKHALLFETVGGLEAIKATLAEGKILYAWEQIVSRSAETNAHNKHMSSLSSNLTMIITQTVSLCTIILGVYLIADNSLTMGGLIGCNMMAQRAMAPLAQVAVLLTRLHTTKVSLESLNKLMAMQNEDDANDGNTYTLLPCNGLEPSITFENVSFTYPKSEIPAISEVSFHIKPGENVGIIGRMGSGKTTLGRLCTGLYKARQGKVLFGGVDVNTLDMSSLRRRVAYVPQDNYLFYGTVRENIAFGVPDASDAAILNAADLAGVTEFVKQHPMGFGMIVGERGMSLSGGQRQAISLARSLLLNPDILILDEPSSNMDIASETALQNRLTRLFDSSKTLIIITHRTSLLGALDRVLIMDNGKLTRDASQQDLMEKEPRGV